MEGIKEDCYTIILSILNWHYKSKEIRTMNGVSYEVRYLLDDSVTSCLVCELKNNEVNGLIRYYVFGVLKASFYMHGDNCYGDCIIYNRGIAQFQQRWSNASSKEDKRIIKNEDSSRQLVILDKNSKKVVYHGEFDSNYNRNGLGYEYDKETGNLCLYGEYQQDKLIRSIQVFTGNDMIEYSKDGTVDYVGGYAFDSETKQYKRNGKGTLIDNETGMGSLEGEWVMGELKQSRELFQGWYTQEDVNCLRISDIPPIPVFSNSDEAEEANQPVVTVCTEKGSAVCPVLSTKDLEQLSLSVENIHVVNQRCNDPTLTDLAFANYPNLTTIKIGDHCFENVTSFLVEGLEQLTTLIIGAYSFTRIKEKAQLATAPNNDRVCRIAGCGLLRHFKMGAFSFADYGRCQLSNLPSLQFIGFGDLSETAVPSYCFTYASLSLFSLIQFVLLIDFPALEIIEFGPHSFMMGKFFHFSMLRKLRTLRFGQSACQGYTDPSIENRLPTSCKKQSLVMKYLPTLSSILSVGGNNFSRVGSLFFKDVGDLSVFSMDKTCFSNVVLFSSDNAADLNNRIRQNLLSPFC